MSRVIDSRYRLSIILAVLLVSSSAFAFDALCDTLPSNAPLTRIFGDNHSRTRVKDGPLLGVGFESTRVERDGSLTVRRKRVYRKIVHPETGRAVFLPRPWRSQSRLKLSRSLRLLAADTTTEFDSAVDHHFEGCELTDEYEELFEADRLRTRAGPGARSLSFSRHLDGELVDEETYEYPERAVPLEIVNLTLAAAVHARIARFDFDLLLPDGALHGVRSVVHRTRDASAFAAGYPLPRQSLRSKRDLALVEMRLASPFKYLMFPHKFFILFDATEARRVLGIWGGELDEHLQAYRID